MAKMKDDLKLEPNPGDFYLVPLKDDLGGLIQVAHSFPDWGVCYILIFGCFDQQGNICLKKVPSDQKVIASIFVSSSAMTSQEWPLISSERNVVTTKYDQNFDQIVEDY